MNKKEAKKRREKLESIRNKISRINESAEGDAKDLANIIGYMMDIKARIKQKKKEIERLRKKAYKLEDDCAVATTCPRF